jgi:hypothetical protein
VHLAQVLRLLHHPALLELFDSSVRFINLVPK